MEQFKQTSRTEQLVARHFPLSLALLADDRAIVVVAKRTGFPTSMLGTRE